MSTMRAMRSFLCAGLLALAGCDEPNEPNAIGPEDFDPAAGVERHIPEAEPSTSDPASEGSPDDASSSGADDG
jgi:hypothetical protein